VVVVVVVGVGDSPMSDRVVRWKFSTELLKVTLISFHAHPKSILVQYSDKFMQSIVKFLIVLLHSLLLCFCTVLLCEVDTI